MCIGAEEGIMHGTVFCGGFKDEEEGGVIRGSTSCELCGLKASLYCQADDAYLCGKCDKWVHRANVLALRHIRCFLCNTCQNLTRRYLIGASIEVILPANLRWATDNNNLTNSTNGRDFSRTQDTHTPFKFL